MSPTKAYKKGGRGAKIRTVAVGMWPKMLQFLVNAQSKMGYISLRDKHTIPIENCSYKLSSSDKKYISSFKFSLLIN